MFRQGFSPLNAGVILRRPFEKLFIGLPQAFDLAGSQALNPNGCVEVQEDDQIESVLQLKAPVHDGTGQDRALFRPHIAENRCQPFRAVSLACERWRSRQPVVIVGFWVGNPQRPPAPRRALKYLNPEAPVMRISIVKSAKFISARLRLQTGK